MAVVNPTTLHKLSEGRFFVTGSGSTWSVRDSQVSEHGRSIKSGRAVEHHETLAAATARADELSRPFLPPPKRP